jgi:hypothetical protein
MGTLNGVWTRLKPLLEAAIKSKTPPDAKADPKKTAAAIQQFITQFAPVMAELEAIYKTRAQVNARFATTAEKGMKLLQPLLQQVDAAHKDGFNPDSSLQGNLDDRLSEMIDRLKELKSYGCQVQWD